ncbi:MAG: hypothetical protein IJB34_04520 [Clostridia bacterium]|nr:hypothetical protein [Clostridia bacterium]
MKEKKETNEMRKAEMSKEINVMKQEYSDFLRLFLDGTLTGDTKKVDEVLQDFKNNKMPKAFHNTGLLLRNYKKIVWLVECFPEFIATELAQPLENVDRLLARVDGELAFGNKKLDRKLASIEKTRMVLELVNEAISVLQKMPKGESMYQVIYLTYATQEDLTKGLANNVTIVANEDVNYTLTMGDAAIDYEMGTTITNPGTYSLVVTDAIGNRTEMSFTVVKSLVSKFEHNFDDMQGFEKVLVNGEDKRLNYGTLELFADGEYEVGVVAKGVTYTFNITVDGTKPTIKLNGVENGGKTENPVTITDLSEKGEVTVYLNNEKLLYELGNELTEDGKYRVVAMDECGNTTEYTFEIKANDSFKYIALATVAGIGVIGAVVFFILKKKKKF